MAQFFRGDAGDVGLDELADLLLECHARNHRGDTRFERGIGSERGTDCGPETGMNHRGAALSGRDCGSLIGQGTQRSGGDYRTEDNGRNFQGASAITRAGDRSDWRGLIAPGPDRPMSIVKKR